MSGRTTPHPPGATRAPARRAPALLCMGDALVDLLSTDPGLDLVDCDTFRRCPGGSALNTSVIASRLGCPTAFATIVGDDFMGVYVRDFLDREGIDTSGLVVRPGCTTGIAFSSSPGGKVVFSYVRGPGPPERHLVRADRPLELLATCRAFHVGSRFSYQHAPPSFVASCFEKARSAGALLTYDPNVRPGCLAVRGVRERILANIAGAHVVKMSDDDAAALYPGTPLEAVARRVARGGALLVVVTRGPSGAIVRLRRRDQTFTVPAPAVRVRDTVGAGDAFMGGLLAGLHGHGLLSPEALAGADSGPVEEIARFATAAGAAACTEFGAQAGVRSRAAVLALMRRARPHK